MKNQKTEEAEIQFSRDLRNQYDQSIKILLDHFCHYKIYVITITNRNPTRFASVESILDDISSIYDYIQRRVFATTTNRGRIPECYRPILPFCLDFPGSKGSGHCGRQRLLDSNYGRIENLHAHGFLLLNPDTKNKFQPDENMRFGNYDIQFKPLDLGRVDDGIKYASKTIESSHLIDIDFSQYYLYFSKRRDAVTPKQLASFRITPSTATTNRSPVDRNPAAGIQPHQIASQSLQNKPIGSLAQITSVHSLTITKEKEIE